MVSQSIIAWPIAAETGKVLDGVNIPTTDNYRWIVIVGGILAFLMAWGIGANDVANAFATSVGSGALSLRWACVIAAFCELGGAILLGNNVTDTVRKKIIDPDVFDPVKGGSANGPELLMTAFFAALIAATVWLILATYLELPVSTTHSIIGALVGTALVYRGSSAVIWISSGSGFSKLKGLVGVILSWFISPILSAIFAVILFIIVRTLVFRTENPVRNGFIFLPFFYGFTVAIACFFIIYKGSPRLGLSKKLAVWQAVVISLGSGAVIAILSYLIIIPLAKKYVENWEKTEEEKAANPDKFAEPEEPKFGSTLAKVGINIDLKEELSDDIIQLHDKVEKFDPKAEKLFTWLQVFTAAFDSFAHGANDVANAVAPFASIFQLYSNAGVISAPKTNEFGSDVELTVDGETKTFKDGDDLPDGSAFCGSVDDTDYFKCELTFPETESAAAEGAKSADFFLITENDDGDYVVDTEATTCYTDCAAGSFTKYTSDKKSVELWILALGGIGIVAGLAMWGYRIITAIGQKLTKLTPSRGFSIEVGAAITVIIASRIGLPVSTTHCQVGATMGVGLAEFKGNTVNWKQFGFICIGWVFTVVFTGLLSAAIYAVLINTPGAYNNEADVLDYCPGERLFFFDEDAEGFRGIGCAGR